MTAVTQPTLFDDAPETGGTLGDLGPPAARAAALWSHPGVRRLWDSLGEIAWTVPLPPRNANNYTYPLVAAYHAGRRAIEAHPEHAPWITASTERRMRSLAAVLTERATHSQAPLWEIASRP